MLKVFGLEIIMAHNRKPVFEGYIHRKVDEFFGAYPELNQNSGKPLLRV
jgi:hypothetical protein